MSCPRKVASWSISLSFKFNAVDKVTTCFCSVVEVSASGYFAPLCFAKMRKQSKASLMRKDTWACKQIHIFCVNLTIDFCFWQGGPLQRSCQVWEAQGPFLAFYHKSQLFQSAFESIRSNSVRPIIISEFNSLRLRDVKSWRSVFETSPCLFLLKSTNCVKVTLATFPKFVRCWDFLLGLSST